jgi:hypothetical protein
VIVDRGQAASTGYVRQALEKLQNAGVKVSSETGPGGKGIMHDKLVLSHYPETEDSDEGYRVMIGSSGLTRNVVENMNYENLLIIDDEKLFKELMVHHTQAAANRRPGRPAVDPASSLGKACALVKQQLGPPDSWNEKTVGALVGEAKDQGLYRGDVMDAIEELKLVMWRGRYGKDWVGYYRVD